jgi:predicted metal-binding protein
MLDVTGVEDLLRQSGYHDFCWLAGAQLPVCQWVRFKCRYGCPNYGRLAACPPEVPNLDACRELFGEYRHVAVIRLCACASGMDEDAQWNRQASQGLLALERAVFLAGFPKVLVLFPGPCRLCEVCTGDRNACRRPADVRPSPEALGVDLFGAVRLAGYDLRILQHTDQPMARFAFLLVA